MNKSETKIYLDEIEKRIVQNCDRDDVYGWTEIKNRNGELKMSKDKKSNYYDEGGIETIDIIKAKLTPEQYTGYLLGNVIKYACRLNFKGSKTRDAEKLANYSKWVESASTDDTPCFGCRPDVENGKNE